MILEAIEVVERRATSRVVAASASPVGVEVPLQGHGAHGETGGIGRAMEIAHRVEAPVLMVHEPIERVGGAMGARGSAITRCTTGLSIRQGLPPVEICGLSYGSHRRALSVVDDLNEASAHNNRGRVLADQERFDDAIEEYRQADELWRKKKSKDRKRALCNWADALREQDHYEQAAEKCQEAIGIDPEFPDAYNSFGLVRAAQERFDEAIEQYRQADALWQKKGSKDRKRALCNWADALRLQEHYDQAAEKCQEAIGIDPEFPDAYNSFGLVRAAQERFDEAIEQYRQADELWQKKGSKDRKRALCNWADALRMQEHYEQAAEKCQQAIGIDPEFPDAYNSFGLVRAAQERFDEAIEQYRQADALWQKKGSKDRKRALCNWADALRAQEHYEQAAEKCQEAIGIDPA